MKERNAFDEITSGVEFDPESIEKARTEQKVKMDQREQLIHRVFYQNEDGRALLDTWVKARLIEAPVLRKGENHDPYDIGFEEGFNTFVRNILLTCEKVDGGN